MKIHDLEHLNSQEIRKNKQNKSESLREFQHLLEKELLRGEGTNTGGSTISSSICDQQLSELEVSLKMEKAHPPSNQDIKENIMSKLSTTLDKWEKYSQSLKKDDLKGSYSLLQDILKDISALEKNTTELQQEDRSVLSLVNEIKILATTEEARFTRGEYL